MITNRYSLGKILISLILITVVLMIPLYSSNDGYSSTNIKNNEHSSKEKTTLNKLKNYALNKASQSIEDYLNYTTSYKLDYVVDGIKHAAEAKLMLDSYVQRISKPVDKQIIELTEIMERLCDDIPKGTIKQHPPQDIRPFVTYLNLLKLKFKKFFEER